MRLLATLDPEHTTEEERKTFRHRQATRAVVFDKEKNIALLFVSKKSFYKLPGGGIEPGESIENALHRECIEEIGTKIEVTGEVGSVIEYRKRYNLVQESFCYLARIVGEKGEPHFEEDEIADGFQIKWMPLAEAIRLVKLNPLPTDYEGPFIQNRDLILLEEAGR